MDMDEGAFTAKAKRHGMSVSEFRRHVLANKEDFDSKTVRQAVLAAVRRGRDPVLATHVRDHFSWTAAARATREGYKKVI